jgi:hypothetical protein
MLPVSISQLTRERLTAAQRAERCLPAIERLIWPLSRDHKPAGTGQKGEPILKRIVKSIGGSLENCRLRRHVSLSSVFQSRTIPDRGCRFQLRAEKEYAELAIHLVKIHFNPLGIAVPWGAPL